MYKKTLAWLLALCMVLTVVPFSAFATEGTTVTDNSTATVETNTEEGTENTVVADLTISTAEELQAFAAAVTAGDNFTGKIVRLGADIDLAGIEWTPIGGWDGAFQFLGEFDGNGKIIKNLSVDSTAVSASKYRLGLFANLGEGSYVHDLAFDNVKLTFAHVGQGGALAGRSGASLKNISVVGMNATSVAGSYVGGVVGITNYYESGEYGFAWENVDAKNVDISFTAGAAKSFGGGILGGMNPNGARLNTYDGCDATNITIVSENDGWHGGLWGWHGRSGAFKYVKNSTVTNVNIEIKTANKADECRIGGICGFVGVSGGLFENVTVSNGSLTSTNGYVGGFTAWSYAWGQDTYKNCSVSGLNITCTSGVAAGFVAASGAGNQTTKCIDCEVKDCTVTGRIASGFAGIDRVGNAGGAYILDGCASNATVKGTELAAGLIARANSDYSTAVAGTTFTGTVAGEGTSTKGVITTKYAVNDNNEVLKIAVDEAEVVYTDTTETANYDSIVLVGNNAYETLADAITAANTVVDADGNVAPATVTLLTDVTLGEKLTVSGNVTITGAHTITRADSYTGTLFAVNTGATLTLDGGLVIDGGNEYVFDAEAYNTDLADWENSTASADNAKWFTPEEGAPVATAYMITTSGKVNLNNVTVKNHYSTNGSGIVSASKGAVVTLTGAQITHNASTSGSGLVVNASAGVWSREEELITVVMNEGTVIDGNHVGGNHGIFKIYMGTYFTMNGGEVKNTTGWNSNGVVVGVYHAVFTMNGGTICSNSSEYGPNNGRNAAIYGHSNHLFTMNGGTICHNTGRSKAGIDSPYSETGYTGLTVINGGTVIDNTILGTWSAPDVSGGATLTITGGTYTQDVTKWLGENCGLVYDTETGYYTVTDDIWEMHLTDASGEAHWLSPMYGNDLNSILEYSKIWYDSLQGTYNFTLKLVANTKLYETAVVDFPITIDLNGHTLYNAPDVIPSFRILSDVTVTGNGTVDNANNGANGYCFILGASDGSVPGNLTIENGTFKGTTTVASVTKGTLTILGGSYKVAPYEESYDYTLNCIDTNYKDGSASIVVKGGTFYMYDPANNAAEGTGTNFVAKQYVSKVDSEDANWYNVELADAFYIYNLEDLNEFAQLAYNGENFEGKTVYLKADIDYEWAEWKPVTFAGTFLGENHTIKNLTYVTKSAIGTQMGFFNSLSGTAKDFTIDGVKATLVSGGKLGGLARLLNGYCENVHIKNITVDVPGKIDWFIGGFAGYAYGYAKDCSVENFTIAAPNATGEPCIGGFIGSIRNSATFTNCDVKNFKATVNCTDGLGIAGFAPHTQTGWHAPNFVDCDVTGIDFTISGSADVAGFVTWPGAHTDATNCTTEGKIDVTGVTLDGCCAGGFYGQLGWNCDLGQMGHVVTDCSADVDIITKVSDAGGFVGSATNSYDRSMYATFNNCSASGNITAVEGGTADIGGFFGDGDRGVYTNCTASGTVTNNGTGYDGRFGGALYDVTPKYDHRYPAGTRDYLVDEITIAQCDATGTSTSGLFIGNIAEGVTLNVAKIGNKYYTSVQAAIDASVEGDVVVLLLDVAVTESIVVSGDHKVTLDLNGHALTNNIPSDAEVFHTIKNEGNLTVIDSVGGGVVESNSAKGYVIYTEGGALVVNGAKLVGINNGYAVVTLTAGDSITIEDGSVIEGRGALYVDGGATAVVNGGTFTMTVQTTNNQDNVVYVGGASELTINGGTFTTGNITGAQRIAIAALGTSKVTINGGTFYGLTGDIQSKTSCNVSVTGGTFTGTKMDERTADSIALTGGTYSYDPTEWVADGYKAYDNGDGTWTVVSYVEWVQKQLFAGNDVTLERDIVINDYDLVHAHAWPSNGNGKYNEKHGNGAIFHIIKPGVVLDLNGHSITWDAHDDDYCNKRQVSLFMVTATGVAGETSDFTVKDSVGTGEIDVYGMASGMYVVLTTAEATIEGGTWTNHPCKTCGASNIFIYPSHGGKLNITGGTFEQKESEYLLGWKGSTKETTASSVGVDYDSTKFVITGGTFIGFNPEETKFFDTANSGQKTINAVAEGYYAIENDGVWTIGEAVAVNVNTGKGYGDVTVALDAAKAGETVKLLKDCAEDMVIITKGVTLDLNGKTLTAGYLVAFNGNHVVDNADVKGKLVINENNISLATDNSMMPVWNEDDGYIFVEPVIVVPTATVSSATKLVFKPNFGTEINALFANGMSDNGVSVIVRLNWTKTDGSSAKQDFIFSEEIVKTVYSSKRGFTFTANGLDEYADMTVQIVLISDLGVEVGGEVYTVESDVNA